MKNKLQEALSKIQESFFDVLNHLDRVNIRIKELNIRIKELTEYADYLRATIWGLEDKIQGIKQLVKEQERE